MRKLLRGAAVAAALTVVGFVGQPLVGAGAATQPVPKATGGIALSTPSQYVSFNAFDYGTTGDRGMVNYTNFTAPQVGTGVWALGSPAHLVFTLGGTYAHTMTIPVASIFPTSNSSYSFSGTGVYDADSSYTWDVMGVVSGTSVTLHIVYTGTNAGYTVHATGTIQPDGSVTGTATDSTLQVLTWTMPAGTAGEVLSYIAPVTTVTVGSTSASFGYTIPTGLGGYSGIPVTMTMTDGGSPGATFDTFGINSSPYSIIGGNLVVH